MFLTNFLSIIIIEDFPLISQLIVYKLCISYFYGSRLWYCSGICNFVDIYPIIIFFISFESKFFRSIRLIFHQILRGGPFFLVGTLLFLSWHVLISNCLLNFSPSIALNCLICSVFSQLYIALISVSSTMHWSLTMMLCLLGTLQVVFAMHKYHCRGTINSQLNS